MWGVATPALGQALVPHSGNRSSPIEQQGLSLAQEAAQLAQFQQYEMALPRARLATNWLPKFPVMVPVGVVFQTNKFNEAIAATGAIATTQRSLNFIRFG